jgi:hypothetical protein
VDPTSTIIDWLWCELRERSITCRQIVRTTELTKVLDMDELFKGRHFDREIIVLCVRWYLRYQLSFRDLVEMMVERGLSLAHTTIMRWIQRYVPELGLPHFPWVWLKLCGRYTKRAEAFVRVRARRRLGHT